MLKSEFQNIRHKLRNCGANKTYKSMRVNLWPAMMNFQLPLRLQKACMQHASICDCTTLLPLYRNAIWNANVKQLWIDAMNKNKSYTGTFLLANIAVTHLFM